MHNPLRVAARGGLWHLILKMSSLETVGYQAKQYDTFDINCPDPASLSSLVLSSPSHLKLKEAGGCGRAAKPRPRASPSLGGFAITSLHQGQLCPQPGVMPRWHRGSKPCNDTKERGSLIPPCSCPHPTTQNVDTPRANPLFLLAD